MPEVAEIALTAQILENELKGKNLTDCNFLAGFYNRNPPPDFHNFTKSLPLKLVSVNSKGKFMWFQFASRKKTWYIWNTFGLTGMWSLEETDGAKFVLKFGKNKASFSDVRNFGKFKFTQDPDLLIKKLDSLAPDILKEDFSLDQLTKYNAPVVKILMDQSKVVSGIGNYLVAEILYRAKISPHKICNSFNAKQLEQLKFWIMKTVKLAYIDNHTGYMVNLKNDVNKIEKINYHPDIDVSGETFQFLVYRKKEDSFGNPVKAEKIMGTGINSRTTYWVPKVQTIK